MDILTEEFNWESIACCAHWLQLFTLTGLSINAIDRLTMAVKNCVSLNHSGVATDARKKNSIR